MDAKNNIGSVFYRFILCSPLRMRTFASEADAPQVLTLELGVKPDLRFDAAAVFALGFASLGISACMRCRKKTYAETLILPGSGGNPASGKHLIRIREEKCFTERN